MSLSIVIPAYNEGENVKPLLKGLFQALNGNIDNFEMILVDDGSTDQTRLFGLREAKKYPNLRVISHKKTQGQGGALRSGIEVAKYDLICPLDADLQYDPQDILRLYSKFNQQLDFICSYRANRTEHEKSKIFFSRVGNFIIRKLFSAHFKDLGCALKICQRQHLLEISFFNNYHRYLALILGMNGLRYREISVSHKSRNFGQSKYGYFKFIGVIFELMWMKYFYNFRLSSNRIETKMVPLKIYRN